MVWLYLAFAYKYLDDRSIDNRFTLGVRRTDGATRADVVKSVMEEMELIYAPIRDGWEQHGCEVAPMTLKTLRDLSGLEFTKSEGATILFSGIGVGLVIGVLGTLVLMALLGG